MMWNQYREQEERQYESIFKTGNTSEEYWYNPFTVL